jgi:hypothetical protein
MRKAISFPSLLLAIALIANAQQPVVRPVAKPSANRTARAEAAASTQLPVTRVSLYKNGVGFFEHSGRVTGDQSVTIDFTTDQLNDVLQSLTAIDLNGGRIAGAGYNSTTPLEQQLKALPLALGEDPSAVDFYNAIRGARVEVRGPGATISGRLLNIENVENPEKDGQPSGEKRLITVIGESGEVRTVELTPATSVTLLDADLHQDVTRYLELLASTRNQGLRHLTLQDNGTGARELHVSYISEVPIWKSTYRILFTEPKPGADASKQTATLQGWSVVDNTTGADWINVQLSLIAGAPQSFIQPLSVPYYSRRPEIGLPQEAQLSPQTHESGEMATASPVMAPPAPAAQRAGMASGLGGNIGGGIYGGTGHTNLNQNYVNAEANATASVMAGEAPATVGGTIENGLYQNLALSSISPNATTAAFDDYFAYNLTEPITIRKNESAMVPILQTKIDAEPVTLWSQQQPVPLRALWITNTSNLTLDRGSFSNVEDGNFGGEGLLDPIHPAEKRLLSYAVDQAVHVSSEPATSHLLRSVAIAKGILSEHYRDIVTREYTIHNAAAEPRTVVLEHTRLNDHQLNSDSTAKPDETTPTLYRFRVAVPSGQTVHFKVAESHAYPRTVQVGNVNDQQIKLLLQEMGEKPEDNPGLLRQLQPVLDAQGKIADLNAQKKAVDADLKGLHDEEERQRANITALKDADKQAQQRFVNDLNHTEDQIVQKQKHQQALETETRAAQQALADLVQRIDFDQKLID